MEKKDVMISLDVVVQNGENDDTISIESVGVMEREGEICRLSYMESDVTGTMGMKTTVETEGQDRVTITREGEHGSQLIMEKGKRHICQYRTEFGDIMLGVSSTHIKNNLTDRGGTLDFIYSLDVNLELTSVNHVQIEVRERG